MEEMIVHISLAITRFACPHCGARYDDDQDKYLNRINAGNQGYTQITCGRCRCKFGMAYNIEGNAVSFKLGKEWKT